MARRVPAAMSGSWPGFRSASGYGSDGSDESENIHDDSEDILYPEPDLALISDLLETIERSPPALEAHVLLMQLYLKYGWHDATEEEARQVLGIDDSVTEAQTILGEPCKVSLRGGARARNGRARAKLASTGMKSKGKGKEATKAPQQRAQTPIWQPSLVKIASPAVSLQELEDGYVALLENAGLLLDEMKLLRDLNAPHCEDQMSDLAAMAKGQVSSVLRIKPLQSVKVVAEAIIADSKDGGQNGLDTAVTDLEGLARRLRKSNGNAEGPGSDMSRPTDNSDQDGIREVLVKRSKALKALLPPSLQPLADSAMMHAEHEFLHRKYINDETMCFDAISGIPRANFWTSEDGYAWDMEELAGAIRSGKGVMRNPLSKQMFTRADIRAIVQHPLGKGLQALQVEQSKLKHGVRPQTINELDTLAKVLLGDMTEDGKPSRLAVEAFVSYLETLPRAEQKAIEELKVPAKDSHTGMAFDTTIGEAVEDMQANRVKGFGADLSWSVLALITSPQLTFSSERRALFWNHHHSPNTGTSSARKSTTQPKPLSPSQAEAPTTDLMGLSTGFLGGLTLTYSLLYLSLYLHRTNRANQHRLLSQQSVLLNSLVDPLPSSSSSFPPTTTTTSRTRPRIRPETLGGEADEEPRRSRRGPLTETLKDRWNAEMEGMVRRVQETDWSEVRERWETRGVNLWRNLTKD